jgi:RNA polymerase sigma factor (sigma-70 family)
MFVHAYLKVGQLRDPARFFPWLKKMARNRSRNFIQRREADVIPLSLVGAKRSSANPDEEILRQELMQAVMEAIEALPARDRQVVKARIDGLSHAEISRRFSISYWASLSRLYRARKKLTDRLKGLYSIFSLAGRLRPKWIISGGVAAVKIGTGAKVTIGVISVLIVGFTGFKIVTHQPDQEVLSTRQATQETPQEPIGNLLSKQEFSVIPVRKSNPMLASKGICPVYDQ